MTSPTVGGESCPIIFRGLRPALRAACAYAARGVEGLAHEEAQRFVLFSLMLLASIRPHPVGPGACRESPWAS